MNNKKGLTLIEVLFAVIIAGVIFSLAFSIQVFGLRSFIVGTSQAEIQQNARLIDDLIRKELRNSQYITATGGSVRTLRFDQGDNRIFYGKESESFSVNGIEKIKIYNETDNRNIVNLEIKGNGYNYSNRFLLNNVLNYVSSMDDLEIFNVSLEEGQNLYYKLPSD